MLADCPNSKLLDHGAGFRGVDCCHGVITNVQRCTQLGTFREISLFSRGYNDVASVFKELLSVRWDSASKREKSWAWDDWRYRQCSSEEPSVAENKLASGKCDVKHSYQSNRTMHDKWAGKLSEEPLCFLDLAVNGIDCAAASHRGSVRECTMGLRDFVTLETVTLCGGHRDLKGRFHSLVFLACVLVLST